MNYVLNVSVGLVIRHFMPAEESRSETIAAHRRKPWHHRLCASTALHSTADGRPAMTVPAISVSPFTRQNCECFPVMAMGAEQSQTTLFETETIDY
jgi:hypothetical protein